MLERQGSGALDLFHDEASVVEYVDKVHYEIAEVLEDQGVNTKVKRLVLWVAPDGEGFGSVQPG